MENQTTDIATLQSTPATPIKVAAAPAPAPVKEKAPSTPGNPSQKQQSWGVVISIVVIVGMIVVGAFYAWGKRISENQVPAVTGQ